MNALERLSNPQVIKDFETRVDFLLTKLTKLKHKLKEEKKDYKFALRKMNESVEAIQKIEEYIGHLGDVLKKAQLSNTLLATNPISGAKVIAVLVDFI